MKLKTIVSIGAGVVIGVAASFGAGWWYLRDAMK